MSGYHCPWYAGVTDLVTAGFVRQKGVWTHTGQSEGYVLTNRPCKLFWNTHGYNMTLHVVTKYDDVIVWWCTGGSVTDTTAPNVRTTPTEVMGTSGELWYYGRLDGYYYNYTYTLNHYRLFGSIAQQGGEHTRNSDIPVIAREDGRSFSLVENAANDGDWLWESVDGYSLSDEGNLVYPEPIGPTTPDEPDEPEEPQADPVSPSGTIVVRVTASAGNPYEPGGDSGIGQGNGTFTNPDDTIDGPSLPQIGIADGTLIAMFNPTQSELNELGDYLFDDSIWTQAMRGLYGQPMDYILSLGIVPVKPKITESKVEFSLGPAPVANLSMWQITRQYDEVDCGEITIPEYWGGFLDYEPYTSIQIYLPYIGYREINPSEVMNKVMHVYYHIDLFTGSCICFIEVAGNILYQFEGNCLVQLPITSVQHAQMMSGIISALGFGATLVATKGLGMFGGMAGDFMTWGAGASAISSIANAAKPSVMHGGNTSASYGIMGIQTPYVIIRRPRQAVATDQNAYSGFASWYRASDFMFTTGFTKVAEIHLDGLAATDWEIQEIERLLKNGVIF